MRFPEVNRLWRPITAISGLHTHTHSHTVACSRHTCMHAPMCTDTYTHTLAYIQIYAHSTVSYSKKRIKEWGNEERQSQRTVQGNIWAGTCRTVLTEQLGCGNKWTGEQYSKQRVTAGSWNPRVTDALVSVDLVSGEKSSQLLWGQREPRTTAELGNLKRSR